MKKILWPLLIGISLSLGILLGGFVMSASYRSEKTIFTNHNKLKLNRLLDFIEQEYVDNVNTDSIVDITVSTLLSQLDPHSVYIARESMQDISESMQGSFVGIGVSYYMYRDTIAVINSLVGGPAHKAGIISGDRILSSNGIELIGELITSDSISSVLRGTQGSRIDLEVYRNTHDTLLEFSFKRAAVTIKSVDVALKLENGLGYIKINRFSSSTYQEFNDALTKLIRQNITGLVLDLRDNTGGYMSQAVDILNDILPANQTIVNTIFKAGESKLTKSGNKGIFTNKDIYVLVNEETASASEIIAGAIQDNDRGLIIGRRTFGKGLVQRELLLGDGSAVRMTIARYYTPSGRSIQKSYKEGVEAYNNDFHTRYLSGELYAADSIKINDTLRYKTLLGRTVYGGGGIVPDVFVPFAQNHTEEPTLLLMKSGLVKYFVFEKIDQHRQLYSNLSQEQTIAMLSTDKTLLKSFDSYLKEKNLNFNLSQQKELVSFYLIAQFIEQLYGDHAYYELVLQRDPMVIKMNHYREENLKQ